MTGKSYQNIHDLLHDLYVSTGRGIARHARYVEWSARKLLEKTRIDGNLSRAQTLLRLHKRLQRSASEVGDPEFEERFEVYRLLIECHEVLVDDLLLQAAFENYAKSVLLAKGYVVHCLSKPLVLARRQKHQPVHTRSVRSAAKRGDVVSFKKSTLGISELLSQPYLAKYPMPASVLKGLQEVRHRRNQLHFQSGMSWTVSQDMLDFVSHLARNIPKRRYPWSRSRSAA